MATIVQQPQTLEFILTLRFLFLGVPLVLFTLCLLSAIRYSLTKSTHADLKHLLARRRSAAHSDHDEPDMQALRLKLEKRGSFG